MKLSDALADMKHALLQVEGYGGKPSARDGNGCGCPMCCAERLVAAIEAHLEAEGESTHAMRRVVQ